MSAFSNSSVFIKVNQSGFDVNIIFFCIIFSRVTNVRFHEHNKHGDSIIVKLMEACNVSFLSSFSYLKLTNHIIDLHVTKFKMKLL